MKKYVINYHTGVTNVVEVDSLQEAKEIAQDGMTYTQENVTIETEDGEVITKSRWYGAAPDEDDQVLMQFGDYGFYQIWIDELGGVVPFLVGLKEFAELLGWDKARLSTKYARQREGKKVRPVLPEPIQILAATPIWTLRQAERYKDIVDGKNK